MDRLIVAVGIFALFLSSVLAGDQWEYEDGLYGPPQWMQAFPTCAGKRQSPINIDTRLVEFDPQLTNFQFHGWDKAASIKNLKVQNKGYTVKVDIDGDLWIEGGGLSGRYKTAQFHFHWGIDENAGSEHTFNGMSYAMEIHIVHYAERYGNISTAIQHPDGLAVLGFFYDVVEKNNTDYEDLMNVMETVRFKGAYSAMDPFPLSSLLPTQHSSFFRYDGSLTTPGCHESVIWSVFEHRIPISEEQLEIFRNLNPDTEESFRSLGNNAQKRILRNFRPVQPLHGRTVYTNTPPFVGEHGPGKSYWSYQSKDGPLSWAKISQICQGTRQSPINIVTKDVSVVTNLKNFVFHGWDSKENMSLQLKNNGHTVQVDINGNLSIEGGGLAGRFIASQFHFHWGFDDSKGSEHTVDGERYPLEMHIVHYAEKYDNISHAMLQPDGLAVLGFFFEIDENNERNENYNPIFNHFREIEYKYGTCVVESFPMSSILPKDLTKYYRYDGSLTTPGCYESVIWTIFKDTVKISRSQLKKFRTLYNIESQHHSWNQINSSNTNVDMSNTMGTSMNYIVDNFRPIQQLHGRPVYASFQPNVDDAEDDGHWSYMDVKMGPVHWHKHFSLCAGRRQSPINIVTARTQHNPELTDFKFYNWNSVQGSKMKVRNNGHTVEVALEGKQYIEGGGLSGRYKAVQFHFHWGSEDWKGSEHTVDGESYPMELHIVHIAEKYGNISNAIDKPDGLAVLGFMFEVSDSHNLRYNDLLTYLEQVQYKGEIKPMVPFPLTNLVPETVKYYYRYLGSLTTPGCYESVIWTIFHDPIRISSAQLEHFRLLYEIDREDFNRKKARGEFWDLAYAPPQAPDTPDTAKLTDTAAPDANINSFDSSSNPNDLSNLGVHPEKDRRKHYHIVDNFRPVQYTFGRVVHTNRPLSPHSNTQLNERKDSLTCVGCKNDYSKVLISGLCFLYMKACSNI